MKRLLGIVSLMLTLCLSLQAQNRPKWRDLLGEWYLNFVYEDSSPRRNAPAPLFRLEKHKIAAGSDYILTRQETPVCLNLMEGERATLSLKTVFEEKGTGEMSGKHHCMMIHRRVLNLSWKFNGKRLMLYPLKNKKKKNEYKYDVDIFWDEVAIIDNGLYLADAISASSEDMLADRLIEHFIKNFNEMNIEHYTGTEFVLNGKDTFKPLRGIYQEPIGEVSGWDANMVYASRTPMEQGGLSLNAKQEKFLEDIAATFSNRLMRRISPNSGKNSKYRIINSRIESTDDGKVIIGDVSLYWDARHFMAGVPYGTCEVSGKLTLYPPLRSVDSWKAKLSVENKNDQAVRVSNTSDWKSEEVLEFIQPTEAYELLKGLETQLP